MKEPNNIRPFRKDDPNRDSDEFAGFAELLRNTPEPGSLPEFDASWLNKKPGFLLDAREQAAVLSTERGSSGRFVQWSALAAILTLVVGGMIYYSSFVPVSEPGTAQKSGEPTRAMAVFVQGQAKFMKPGMAEPAALYSGTVLEEGTRVETGPGTRVDLAFSKGSIIRISADSHLVVENLRILKGVRNVGLNLEQGSVLNVVDRLSPGEAYTVTTPTAIAGVRGTAFRMETDGVRTRVICDEGSVSVEPRRKAEAPQESIVLSQKQSLSIAGQEQPGAVEPAPVDEAAARDTAELREALKSFDPEVVTATLALVEVKSEADIERIYQRDLETIILKDGRNLRGIVASQLGDRLIIQTAGGQLVVPLEQVKEIYQN